MWYAHITKKLTGFNTVFSLLFLMASLNEVQGQTPCEPYSLLYQAEALYRSKTNLDSAIVCYDLAFHNGIKDISKVLEAVSCAASVKDTMAMTRFMKFSLLNGLDFSDFRRLWSHLGNEMDLEYFAGQLDTAGLHQAYRAGLEPRLVRKMAAWSKRDQRYRGEDNQDDAKMARCDTRNFRSLQRLIERRGRLPYHTELGMTGSDDLSTLLHHVDKEALAYLLPFIVEAIKAKEFFDASVILYQLDRIGMGEGLVYTITPELKIIALGQRTQLTPHLVCQSLGEWFPERHPPTGKLYFVPIDPLLTMEEVNRVRQICCLDSIQNKWAREPWVEVLERDAFHNLGW